jgi:transcriptional regulator with XRE-family HTH domain
MKDRIAKLMELEQLSPTRFASMVGIQPSIVSHILNGRNKVSLEVAQKILKGFSSINPDWLILGVGTMYREELPSRQTSLFDVKPEIDSNSATYEQKQPEKEVRKIEVKPDKERIPEIVPVETKEKTVKKITVYYSDKTFEEFLPND